ncbi:MAG: hypothetical protein ACFFFK_09655 [Candidatus Thorarchaeota archaeon]
MKNHAKILIVSLFLALFFVPVLISTDSVTASVTEAPVKTTQVSQIGYKVLFDEAHCALGSEAFTPANASLYAWILEEQGYETDTNFDQQLDSGILSGVDILFLVFPMVALTGAEVTAVNNFVQAGGGLILVGTDNSPTWHFSSVNLNALSQTYGITFNTNVDDSWVATITDLGTHQITQDVSSIHSNIDYKLKGTTLTVESPATTVVEYDGDPVVAVSEYGSGKVVCVGALAPFLQFRRELQWQVENDDLFQFGLNIADWLVGISPRKVVVPAQAVIPIGTGPALTPTEVESYVAYNGIIHDHTTHSDGADSPADMLWSGVMRGLDYMVMTDHSYESPNPGGTGGITGALAMRGVAESNGIDIKIIVGAELSRGHHSLAFPLTANIYVQTQADMIAGAHAQGAMISLCHPTISAPYMETYVQWESYGYDAIEIDNTGFYHGLWEDGYTKPFYGASDGHSFEFVGKVVNVIFVNETTGPDGSLSDMDIVNAILEKRLVIVDKISNIVAGQQVWLDRYFELMGEAETEITNAAGIIDTDNGNKATLAELYLEDAQVAYDYCSPQRAIELAHNATSAEAQDIAIEVVSPEYRFVYDQTQTELILNITNDYTDAIQFNMSRYFSRALASPYDSTIAVIPSNGYLLLETNITTQLEGYFTMVLNLLDFNASVHLKPTIFGIGGIINVGMHSSMFSTEVGYTGTNVTIAYPIARGDARFLKKVVGFYDDGSGWQNGTIRIRTATLEGTVGPFPKNTVITMYFVVYDIFGGVFVSPQGQYTVTTDPLEPPTTTTPTNTGTGPPIELDPMVLAAIGGGVAVIVIIGVVVMKKKQ